MLKFFTYSRVIINIQGVNLNRVVNEIRITIGKVHNLHRIDSQNIQLSIPTTKLDYLIAKYKNSCYNISIVRYCHKFDIFDWSLSHLGIILGACVGLIILAILNLFCLGYNVQCSDTTLRQDIQHYLSQHHIIGTPHSHIDYHQLEYNLLQQFPNLSMVNISRRGVFLILHATSATLPQDNPPNNNGNIVANCDGVITRMHLVSGTALVSVGDIVHEGQILIANYYVDIFGNTIPCEAIGTVYARHWYSATIDYPLHSVQYIRTGEYVTAQSIIAPGINIPISTVSDIPKHCEVHDVYTSLTSYLGIPLKLHTIYYYYLEPITLDNDFEADKEAVIFEAKHTVASQCDTTQVIDQKYTISMVGDIYFVTYYMCVEIQIT